MNFALLSVSSRIGAIPELAAVMGQMQQVPWLGET